MFAIVGYMTVYSYYAWPEKVRPRISQVLVFPPFQRQGHCARLLETFYAQSQQDNQILDITGKLRFKDTSAFFRIVQPWF